MTVVDVTVKIIFHWWWQWLVSFDDHSQSMWYIVITVQDIVVQYLLINT